MPQTVRCPGSSLKITEVAGTATAGTMTFGELAISPPLAGKNRNLGRSERDAACCGTAYYLNAYTSVETIIMVGGY
jgi:hypothetical protein